MKSRWILTLTAAALGMTLMLTSCGGRDDDMSSDGSSHSSSHTGTSSNTSRAENSNVLPDMSNDGSMTDSTGGLGDLTGSR